MKQLTFLISSNYNNLFDKIISYMVDRGHKVYCVQNKDSSKWLEKYTYNLSIVDANNVDYSKYDYVLYVPDTTVQAQNHDASGFFSPNHNQHHNISYLNIEIQLTHNKQVKVSIVLYHNNDSKVLVENIVDYANGDLEHLYKEITETFIDAVVGLLRSSNLLVSITHSGVKPQLNNINNTSLATILQLEQNLNVLEAYYEKIESGNDGIIFSPRTLSSYLQICAAPDNCIKQLDLAITKDNLEVMLLWVLMLLNSRQKAIYKYDFIDKNRRIAKCVQISPQNTYATIIDNLHNAIYSIIDNPFFHEFNIPIQASEVLLAIDDDFTNEQELPYLIRFNYNTTLHKLTINYDMRLYFFDEIATYIGYFENNLSLWQKNSSPISDILYTELEHYYDQLYGCNQIKQLDMPNETIQQLFEKIVAETPDNNAIAYENVKLTYRDLNEKSNQLANYLIEQYDIQPDDFVALCLNRSEYMIIAILAILKSGGAYIPIDPSYPEARINYILEDTKAKLLLTNGNFIFSVKTNILDIYVKEFQFKLATYPITNPLTHTMSKNLAYVMYTSGTTGMPKGVLIEHGSIASFCINNNFLRISSTNTVLGYSNYVFDGSVFDIFYTLINGGMLVIANIEHILDDTLFKLILEKHKVDTLFITTALFNQYCMLERINPLGQLHNILFGGEKADYDIVRKFIELYPKVNLLHMYGPTENVVYSTYCKLTLNNLDNVPIGKKLEDKTLYVLDDGMMPLPIGTVGELYIGGMGVARGYLNHVNLTAEKFITNPYSDGSDKKNTIVYRTGDLVSMLSNGDLSYVGRIDSQIKLNGNRIELGEIESVIKQHPAVKQAVALFDKKRNNIYAYYTTKHGKFKWWPSTTDYYIFDDFLYSVMLAYDGRNKAYHGAIKASVKGKIVLDIGTGPEANFARLCIEEGAKKVYAIEFMEEPYYKAQQLIMRHQLEGKIILIHGDSTKITLPEKVDVCISALIGNIGSSQGCITIVNDAKNRHVKNGGVFIPSQCVTNIATFIVDNKFIEKPYLTKLTAGYCDKIFQSIGYKFDLPMCIEGLNYHNISSTVGVFENLEWDTNIIEENAKQNIRIDITKNGMVYGFIVWVHLFTNKYFSCDTMLGESSSLPLFLPVFPLGENVTIGDSLDIHIIRTLCKNRIHYDYTITGKLFSNERVITFCHELIHSRQLFKHNKFYQDFFDLYEKHAEYALDDLKFLTNKLPSYMIPSDFIHISDMPLNSNGKIDKNKLYLQLPTSVNINKIVLPHNQLECELHKIWADVLLLDRKQFGIDENFFKLGGNSIKIIQLKTKLSQLEITKNIRTSDLYQASTIRKQYQLITTKNKKNNIKSWGSNNHDNEQDIAIIGLSGAFSGCGNIEDYWRLICNGFEGIKRYNTQECIDAGIAKNIYTHPDFVAASGHIQDIDQFDVNFWDMSPTDAKQTDPQIRKFLEHCWNVLELSGYIHQRRDLNIGVFAGGGSNSYFNQSAISSAGRSKLVTVPQLLVASEFLATFTSYKLGLTGASNNINTACSTGLVIIADACKNLVNGVCDMALAGSVCFLLPDQLGYLYQEGNILSQDGHCRVFDNEASGTVLGSGIGVLLLKRLSDAKKNNDDILAVIRGYATNNDGDRKNSYTAPSAQGQAECIFNAYKMAGVSPHEVSYIECHGTGTKLGDSIEIAALNEVFDDTGLNKIKFNIGAVKANIGHTYYAAGLAGVIKICKMMEHSMITKQTNYSKPNMEIDLNSTNFTIATENTPWTLPNNHSKIAGISCFGVGGTNSHMIISEYNSENNHVSNTTNHKRSHYVLPLSAKSIYSLQAFKVDFTSYLQSTTNNLDDISYTLQLRREQFNYRLFVECDSITDAINKLNSNENIIKIFGGIDSTVSQEPELVFVFAGQGVQYANMSIELYQNDSDYKNLVNNCFDIANRYTNIQLKNILFPALARDKCCEQLIHETQYTQILLFIVSYSLAKLLEKLNIKATTFIGHSIGEWVSATLAGVFNLEDAIKLVIARGRVMQSMPEGCMLSVSSNINEISRMADEYKCELAAINSPKSFVVSGDTASVHKLKNKLDMLGVSNLLLKVSHAYHSSMMDGASQRFLKEFDGIKLERPHTKFISNISGKFINPEDAINPNYWAKHIRHAVHFSDGVNTIFTQLSEPNFIEVSPGSTVTSLIKQCTNKKVNFAQILDSHNDVNALSNICFKESILGKLWVNGIRVDFDKYYKYDKTSVKVAKLPTYHFEHKSYWIDNDCTINPHVIENQSQKFFTREWRRSNMLQNLADEHTSASNKKILIFYYKNYNAYNDLEKFITYLMQNGLNNNIFIVELGKYTWSNTYNHFILDANNPLQLEKLVDHLSQSGFIPELVMYFSACEDGGVMPDVNMAQYEIISLYFIYKIVTHKFNTIYSFIAVSCNNYDILGNENICATPVAIAGMLKSISLHNHLICVKYYDILKVEDNISTYINILFDEATEKHYNLYAIRNGYKWCSRYVECKINDSQAENLFRTYKTFIITGGMGGVGKTIAKYIIEHNQNALILLIGRRTQNECNPDLMSLKNIADKRNINFVYLQCSLGNAESVDLIINKLHDLAVERIDLIIHAAGVSGVLKEKSIDSINNVIKPKVVGLTNIINIAKTIKINTIINVSSLSSVVPFIDDYLDYVAANEFLNESVYRRYENIKRILTIGLNEILDIGMAYNLSGQIAAGLNNNVIFSHELPDVFNTCINMKSQSPILISNQNIEQMLEELDQLATSAIIVNRADMALPIESRIAKIFAQVLGFDSVDVDDDFFLLGGTSVLGVTLVSTLQKNELKVNLRDVFDSKTPRKISNLIKSSSNTIYNQLEQIQRIYTTKQKNKQTSIDKYFTQLHDKYFNEIKRLHIVQEKRTGLESVMLTGVTGHLGSNLLYELLSKTNHIIYLPVRATCDEDAYSRVNTVFKYYFDTELIQYIDRVRIFAAEIEQIDLGVTPKYYNHLLTTLDSIIHCAALVKHYGDYDVFYTANVRTTINLLELSRQTLNKDFHFISTMATVMDGCIPERSMQIISEMDDISKVVDRSVYGLTKYEAECAVNQHRNLYHIKASIYRLGNIAMHSKTFKHQINIEENALFVSMNAIMQIGVIAPEIAQVEFLPVDYTASAIVQLFEQKMLYNQIYHIFNPTICDLGECLNIKMVNINEFINDLQQKYSDTRYSKIIEQFMLHQSWLDTHPCAITNIIPLQDRTTSLLKLLGFNYPSQINVNAVRSVLHRLM